MMGARPLMRIRRLSGEQRRLLLRATLVLTAASAAVAVLPFRRAIRFGSATLGAVAQFRPRDACGPSRPRRGGYRGARCV